MSAAPELYDVAVVGGGIAGTSCALGCAEAGYSTIVLSSSLDVVGLPGYGPVAGPVPTDCRQAVTGMPLGAGRAWRSELLVEPKSGVAVVDPRRLSLRLKWELEAVGRLVIRQGLVVAVEEAAAGSREARVIVRTALEEEFVARACVLAPGCGLRGHSVVGRQTLGGGRYGEVPANDLADQLRRAGVPTELGRLEVGGCFRRCHGNGWAGGGLRAEAWWEALRGFWGDEAEERTLVGLWNSEDGAGRDDEGCAPEQRGAAPDLAIAPPSRPRPWALVRADGTGLFPAGEALEEWYLSPGLDPAPLLAAGLLVTRPAYLVEAEQFLMERGGEGGGRLEGGEVLWAAGRVAGCLTYWESLLSGREVAKRVCAHLSGPCAS